MNKEKKYVILVILIIMLAVCITINFTEEKNSKKVNNSDIINIDCNDENCEKEIKKKNDNVNGNDVTDNNNENASDNSNSNNNISGETNQNVIDNSGIQNSNQESNVSSINGNNSDSESGNTDASKKDEEDFIVSDNYQVWTQHTDLKIFNVKQIAPGDYGVYDFFINNNTSKNVKYNISFDEFNIYNANLMYKLKRNDDYVAGSSSKWVKFNELNIRDKVLNSKNNDAYTIEWKWVDSDNDTTVGRTLGAKYTLKISIKAAETDEFDKNATASFNPNTGDKVLYYIELALLASIILMLIIIKRNQKD